MTISLGIVTGSLSREAGGLFNSVRKSAIYLSKGDADVHVYGLSDNHVSMDLPEWGSLHPTVLSTRKFGPVIYSQDLSNLLAAASHDVLHLHGIWQLQSRSVNAWKRRTGRPVMISPRGMLDGWALANSGWKKRIAGIWFENRNLREADCLHALNLSEAEAMRAYGLTNPIAVIPNATDLVEIGSRRFVKGRRTLLYLGRIHPKKGLVELVQAWSIACREHPKLANDWRLEIAGWDDGGHIPDLRKLIFELGVSDSVKLSGPSYGPQKDALLRSADVFILPSYSEGLPMSVLEAWSFRLPVMMTAECNLPEGFSRGAAIEITNDPRGLSEKLISTLYQGHLLEIGEAGRALVNEQFSWARIAGLHLAVYRWLIDGGVPPACVSLDHGQ